MSYVPTPTLQAYWDAFPFVIHLSKVRCPVHRQTWLFMDELTETAHCFACDRDWTTTEIVAQTIGRRSTGRAKPTLPPSLRRFYPAGVTCPRCWERLRLRVRAQEGTCPACDQTYTFSELEDAAAQKLMEEEPNGATVYHKPRHVR